MKELRTDYSISALSRTLGVPRATVYRKTSCGPRATEDTQLTQEITRVFWNHKRRYGSPRVTTELRSEGYTCGENRVARLMRKAGLMARTPKRKTPRTTDSRHGGPVAPNLLKHMNIDAPNQAWAMDITYIPQGNRWAYLAAVLDLYLHKVVGWEISNRLHSDVVCAALQKAQRQQGNPSGVVVHSDRGCQYASETFMDLCREYGCIRSMSAKGNCYDNATMESFFGVLKREDLNDYDFETIEEVRAQVFEYIETYYNRIRIHTALGMSPQTFEAQQQTPSAEFSQACVAPMVEGKVTGEKTPQPRPTVAMPGYPLEGCSPAEPSSVLPDTPSIQHQQLELKH